MLQSGIRLKAAAKQAVGMKLAAAMWHPHPVFRPGWSSAQPALTRITSNPLLQDVVAGDPIAPGSFHRHTGDVARFGPVRQATGPAVNIPRHVHL